MSMVEDQGGQDGRLADLAAPLRSIAMVWRSISMVAGLWGQDGSLAALLNGVEVNLNGRSPLGPGRKPGRPGSMG